MRWPKAQAWVTTLPHGASLAHGTRLACRYERGYEDIPPGSLPFAGMPCILHTYTVPPTTMYTLASLTSTPGVRDDATHPEPPTHWQQILNWARAARRLAISCAASAHAPVHTQGPPRSGDQSHAHTMPTTAHVLCCPTLVWLAHGLLAHVRPRARAPDTGAGRGPTALRIACNTFLQAVGALLQRSSLTVLPEAGSGRP